MRRPSLPFRPLLLLVLPLLAALVPGARADSTGADGARPHRVRALLVGNSYSRFNDLPEMLEAIAASVAGGPSVRADIAFKAGVGLRTHWQRGLARRMLREGDYTHVVLQGHSRAVFDFPGEFLDYAARFKRDIDEAGAQAVLFTTWARHPSSSLYALGRDARSPMDMQTRIDSLYRRAAERIGAEVAPVGEAWLVATARWPHLRLHRPDASHPTMRGTYLTACVLYGVLTDRNPAEVRHRPRGMDRSLVAHLRRVASETLGRRVPPKGRRPRVAGTEGADDLDAPRLPAASDPASVDESARSLDTP